jgi:hypothetical protein
MPRHVVVDGSNLATEGRSMPSLKQLNEAVLAYMADHPNDLITVVVDATFGHRIDPKEVPEFDAAIANNELVAPPAGAIGRGDAFVLSIADKVGAIILSNDSYQEFHGQYEWLFDEGRLVGGKPVPHVGWVFVARVPVRGPVSRKATRSRKQADATVRLGSKEASRPMPVPKAPPPGARRPAAAEAPEPTRPRGRGRAAKEAVAHKPPAVDAPTPARGEPVNALLPFLGFVEAHPVGSRVEGAVESYSSHGAYVTIGDVRGYVPLRLMSDPPPRSARERLKLGESIALVVASFHAARRSIDLALEEMSAAVAPAATAEPAGAPRKRAKKAEAAVTTPAVSPPATKKAAAKKAATKKAAAKKAAAKKAAPETVPGAKTTAAKKAAEVRTPVAKKAAATKAPAAAAEKAPAVKKAAEKAPAAKRSPASKTAVAAKAPAAKKAPVQKASTAKKAAAAKKAPPKKAAAAKKAPPA